MSPSPTTTNAFASIRTVYVTTPAILGPHDRNVQLSSGRIAGITISAVIALHVLAAIVILLWHRRRRRRHNLQSDEKRTERDQNLPEKLGAEESAQPSRMPSSIELGGNAVFEIMDGALHELPGRNMDSRRSGIGNASPQTRGGGARPRTAGTLARPRDMSRQRPGTARTLGTERRSMSGRPLDFATAREALSGSWWRPRSASAHSRQGERPPSAVARAGIESARTEDMRRSKSVDEWMLFERRKSAPWITRWD